MSTLTFAQGNRNETLLVDEKKFNIIFMFQYQDEVPFSITFYREDNTDFLLISGDSCSRNNSNTQQLVDLYAYEQMLAFFDNIKIKVFQPNENAADSGAKLRVQGSLLVSASREMNAFVFLYNPNNMGEENEMLQLISQVITDNALDACSSDFAEQFSDYVNGEE